MVVLFDWFRWLHIAAGFIALFIFWIPIVTKKGGKIHRRFGLIYVYAMATVSISAFYMGIYRILLDPFKTVESVSFAWFLIFISVLSAASAWYGMRVLRYKSRNGMHTHFIDISFPIILLTSGVGICIYGLIIDFPLLKYFPLLGVFLGSTQLVYWLKKPKLKMHWMIEHIVGMLTCCIATITAFTVFGAPRLLNIESVSLIIWLLPTVVIVPLIIGFTYHYQKKFNPDL